MNINQNLSFTIQVPGAEIRTNGSYARGFQKPFNLMFPFQKMVAMKSIQINPVLVSNFGINTVMPRTISNVSGVFRALDISGNEIQVPLGMVDSGSSPNIILGAAGFLTVASNNGSPLTVLENPVFCAGLFVRFIQFQLNGDPSSLFSVNLDVSIVFENLV
jgi:hypothetical protein